MTLAHSEPAALQNSQLAAAESVLDGNAAPSTPAKISGRLSLVLSRIRSVGLGAIALGLAVSVSGAVWAILVGVAYPVAIMVGYSTLVATICLVLVLSKLSKAADTNPNNQNGEEISAPPAVSEAWKYVSKYRVSDAARLWCEVEPGAMATQEVIAWGYLLLDAIEGGELAYVRDEFQGGRRPSYLSDKPHWSTEVTRNALTAWARRREFNPSFLQD